MPSSEAVYAPSDGVLVGVAPSGARVLEQDDDEMVGFFVPRDCGEHPGGRGPGRPGPHVLCAPASCVPAHPGVVWRPLTEPVSRYPWSVLWRAEDHSKPVRATVSCARELSRELGWLETSRQAAG